MNSPDIKRPGNPLKAQLPFFGGLILIMCVIIGGAYYYKYHVRPGDDDMQAKRNREVMTSQGIDPSFFDVLPEPEPEPEPEIEPEPVPIIKMDLTMPPEPEKPKASELFKVHKKPTAIDNAKALNDRRRGKVAIFVKNPVKNNQGSITEEITGKWKESKTKASLPIDMSRVITVDRFIPAILINEINSELGGKVIAQIEEHVFGSHSRKILIPAGSKAIGRYKPIKKIGQERIAISWVRIITPNGINIHTADAEMTDAMGRSGLTGEVDSRYTERYGMSLLVSLFTAVTSYSIPVRDQNQQIVIESFGKEQSGLAKTILEEHIEIKPRITIAAGSRILITASKDIWFKKLDNQTVKVLPLERRKK